MKSPFGRVEMEVGPHYQDKLSDLIRAEKPEFVIETGLYKGLGAEYILEALDDNNKGHLYSIDPTPHAGFINNPIKHPRFTWVNDFSQKVLPSITEKIDFFVHDSDHGYDCQTFEYEWAWNNVPSGGIIATDDPWWGCPAHFAWSQFLARHGMNVKDAHIIGNAMWVRRP